VGAKVNPSLAAVLCTTIVAVLMRRDVQQNATQSSALWIPLIWMFLAGGRWASSWLDLRPTFASPEAYSEGSPVDAVVFLLLIIAGATVLLRRGLEWRRICRTNALLIAYFAFCLLSTAWSDDTFISLKRWFKDLGNPIMVLIILTDKDPVRAIGTLIRRLSYLFLPLSILFIKYYPELGRAYHWDGSQMYTGVGQQKNQLGQMCLITGIYFAWLLIHNRSRYLSLARVDRWVILVLVACMIWLQSMSDSQTALSCLIACIIIVTMTRIRMFRADPGRIPAILAIGAVLYFALELTFDIKANILMALGRRPDLTNRTEIWEFLLNMGTNPLVGTGFMSFWMGDRMYRVWAHIGTIVQAHSGYVEQFLNLGTVGVAFIALLMLRAFLRIRAELTIEPGLATLRLCFLVASALYNYAEAAFFGISNIWILLLLAIIHIPPPSEGSAAIGSTSVATTRRSAVATRT
jgi:O-antigen ligase